MVDWENRPEKGYIIPDGEILYRYVKPSIFPEGQERIPSFIFNDRSLSCDWAKYQPAPDKSFHIQEGKTVIIAIIVCDEIRNPRNPKRTGQIVEEWRQQIIYDPITTEQEIDGRENIAHALIEGLKKGAVTDVIAKHAVIYQVVSGKENPIG